MKKLLFTFLFLANLAVHAQPANTVPTEKEARISILAGLAMMYGSTAAATIYNANPGDRLDRNFLNFGYRGIFIVGALICADGYLKLHETRKLKVEATGNGLGMVVKF